MASYQSILEQYWGFKQFRPLQEDIIQSVLKGKDTLGLMPTGGGKSLTFQVPALTMEGLCVVITPLVALMKDQVEKLLNLDIKAQAIYSGMTFEEIDTALNNCIYGNYKFLYIAPERINTELFRERFSKMPVNLITVDEAHCISQWGYDFRPSYLRIADLRKYFPDVPVLALTATATSKVIDDIQDKLQFKTRNALRKSFERKNLVYSVKYTENKEKDLLIIVNRLKGCGIIYARSRRKCKELAGFLKKNKISADFYHAGLNHETRSTKQDEWTKGITQVIVATNAFGMGIDKADVRFVIHIDLPDSIEAYFQEAGRAGRDEATAHAILLYSPSDQAIVSQRILVNFPEVEKIKEVYQAVGNYLRVPYGGGKGMMFDFNLLDFSSHYKISSFTVYSSLKLLEREGYIELTDELNNQSKVKFLLLRDDLYKFQVANAQFDAFIKLILRSYTGIFTDYSAIDELQLAKRANVPVDVVFQYLNKLDSLKVISYIPQRKTPLIIYNEERLDDKSLYISKENYKDRKERFVQRLDAIIKYATSKDKCRSRLLLEYFGERDVENCNKCDFCRNKKEEEKIDEEFELMKDEIMGITKLSPVEVTYLIDNIPFEKEKLLNVVRWLIDNGNMAYNEENKLIWKD